MRHRYTWKHQRYNTRIAPSPTGHAHIGTFRTAYFCWLAAQQSGGTFYLRIDDTDTARNVPEAILPIREALEWLEITAHDSFSQSQRLGLYREYAGLLLNAELACELSNGAVALKWVDGMPLEWVDNIAGPMTVSKTNIEQIDNKLILLKGKESDYAPTYQFASAFDDWDKGINYIIRGTDHISNTPKQLAIMWALQRLTGECLAIPEFAHLGLIFKDGKKLSKRDGASSVLQYREDGYMKGAILSGMLRLGWAPSVDNKENDMLDTERASRMFLTEGSMRNVNCNLDLKKLDFYNKQWIKRLGPDSVLAEQASNVTTKAHYERMAKIYEYDKNMVPYEFPKTDSPKLTSEQLSFLSRIPIRPRLSGHVMEAIAELDDL